MHQQTGVVMGFDISDPLTVVITLLLLAIIVMTPLTAWSKRRKPPQGNPAELEHDMLKHKRE